MPDCSGEWEWHPHFDSPGHTFVTWHNRPFRYIGAFWLPVLVTETPASGRLCRELKMGGSALVGFAPWSGSWRKV